MSNLPCFEGLDRNGVRTKKEDLVEILKSILKSRLLVDHPKISKVECLGEFGRTDPHMSFTLHYLEPTLGLWCVTVGVPSRILQEKDPVKEYKLYYVKDRIKACKSQIKVLGKQVKELEADIVKYEAQLQEIDLV